VKSLESRWHRSPKGLKATGINLTPEPEKINNDERQAGHCDSVEEAVGEALQVLREKKQFSAARKANSDQREAVRETLAFVEQNHVSLEEISVKELIHEGHCL
jgi:hypothetical protein